MKFYLKPVLSVLVLAVLLGYAGCKGGGSEGPTEEEVQLGKLNGTWVVGASDDVTLDDVSKKTDYEAFTLTLNGTAGSPSYNYSTAGRPALSPWPSSGTWTFGAAPATQVVRDKGGNKQLDMNYSVTDAGDLEITFNYAGAGEAGKVTGTWIFKLTKQQ